MNTRSRRFMGAMLACTISTTVSAQSATRPLFPQEELAGFIRRGTAPGRLHVRDVPTACTMRKICTNVLGAVTNIHIGGSAYDARFQGVWNTDGVQLKLQRLRPTNCAPVCFRSVAKANALDVVSGLAINDSRCHLWQLETAPGVFGLVRYDISGTPAPCATADKTCLGKLPHQRACANGLAFDEDRDLLYIGASTPVGRTGFTHYLGVARVTSPCDVRWCELPGPCFTSFITGFGYDACGRRLFVSDATTSGSVLQAYLLTDPLSCKLAVGPCCSTTSRFGGLTYVPTWNFAKIGSSCSAAPCPTCPTMTARLANPGGAPVLGNKQFAAELVNAPAGNPAALYVKVGTCNPVPLGCGTFYPFPPTLSLVSVITGAGGCTGTAKQPIPLPPNAALCDLRLCLQWVVFCPGGGHALSEGIEFSITGG